MSNSRKQRWTKKVWGPHPLEEKLKPFGFFFRWMYWFYPEAREISVFRLLLYFFPQKILRRNGRVPWPVHFTSTVTFHKYISPGRMMEMGKMHNSCIQGMNGIQLGNNVRVGPGVKIASAEVSYQDFDYVEPAEPIQIGNNVWIGMNAVIMPGVRIGDNVVISANATVERDIPPNSIAAGNPCRVIMKKESYQGKDYGIENV